jgi:CHAT domain-containing protein
VHLSCHGEANMSDPASGRLILPDYATAPLTVADIGAQRADGDLAFLSACSTGRTSPALSNEAIHLTGAFHLAGFRSVIGTLWPVLDSAASRVTRDFYRTITERGTLPPDPARSAPALHDATRRLRDGHPDAPGIWAAFTHTGP